MVQWLLLSAVSGREKWFTLDLKSSDGTLGTSTEGKRRYNMFMLEDPLNEIIEACNAQNNPTLQERIMRRLNQDLRSIARIDSWADLRRKIELSYSGSPIVLPPNMIGIDLAWDDTYFIEYIDRNRSATKAYERMNRYFVYPVESVLASVDDGAVQQDGTTFVSEELLALGLDTDDEWFSVDGEEQYYQITENTGSLYTFSPAYRGLGNKTASKIVVRPLSSKYIDFIGPLGADATTGTIDLHYWIQPDLVRDPTDMIPLPNSDVLTLRVISRMPEAKERRAINRNEVKEVLDEALSQNPDKPMAKVLKGKNRNNIFDNGDPYGSRNNTGTTTNPMECRWKRYPI